MRHTVLNPVPAFAPAATAAALMLLLGACSQSQIVEGECRPVYGSEVCTWSEMKGTELLSFGATVPIGAVENAPAEMAMVFPPPRVATIPLAAEVKTATGFSELTVYWEPHGHPPGPYLTPHFDFHFNHLPSAEIRAIDCSDTTKPTQTPTGYILTDLEVPGMGVLVGTCVPQMGMHALPESEMQGTTPFTGTMVIGYYGGKPTFVEPMLSRAALLERKSFTVAMPTVPDLPAGVRHPTSFRADYDSTAQSYRFVFSGIPAAMP